MNSARITGFQYLKNENPLHSYRLVVDVNVKNNKTSRKQYRIVSS